MQVEIATSQAKAGFVTLLFTNDATTAQWLARPRAVLGDQPEGGFLEFEPPVSYIGLRAKRGPYGEEELVAVQPGESIESDVIELARYYRVPDAADVRVRYASSHPLSGVAVAGGPFERLESDWVTVAL